MGRDAEKPQTRSKIENILDNKIACKLHGEYIFEVQYAYLAVRRAQLYAIMPQEDKQN